MLHQFVVWLAHTVGQWGYSGIVVLMFLESSFFPFPSEVVIPPTAYLAASGEMNIGMVILCGTLGSLLGAAFNYGLASRYGRPFFEKYGRYLLVSHKTLVKADLFFERHGHISMFIGRLVPGIRQYISLPTGIARMNLLAFCSATVLGAGLWVVVLAAMSNWFSGTSIGSPLPCLWDAAAWLSFTGGNGATIQKGRNWRDDPLVMSCARVWKRSEMNAYEQQIDQFLTLSYGCDARIHKGRL